MKRTFTALFAASLFCTLPLTAQAGGDAIRSGIDGIPLGAYSHAKWVSAYDMIEKKAKVPMMQKNDRFDLYRYSGKVGTGTVTGIKKDVHDCIHYTIGVSDTQYKHTPLLAVDGTYNAMPRPVEILPTNNAVYLDIVKKILVSKGLTKAKPHIVQLMRADLNNNGQSEVVIVATNISPWKGGDTAWNLNKSFTEYGTPTGAPAQSYSLVIVRQIEGGKVKDHVIRDYIAKNKAGPDVDDWNPPYLHRVETFADLNSDGKMEIILTEEMYEGVNYQVYEQQRNGSWKTVLENGFGA